MSPATPAHSKTAAPPRVEKHGLLLLDKPSGCTSHDMVRLARRALRQRKIGHCGTLDPAATGLLLLTLGRGTRLTQFLIRAPKVYEGSIRLGAETDTYDAAGEITAEHPWQAVTPEQVRAVMSSFEGDYEQTPPPYCAKKIKGRKYYELARKGEQVPVERNRVHVYEFSPLQEAVISPNGQVEFKLACSSGTYARSLANHLGQEVGCGGHLASLRRLQIGNFQVADAITASGLEQLDTDSLENQRGFVPFDSIPLPFETLEADPHQERRIVHGQAIVVSDLEAEEGDWIKLVNGRGHFIAVGSVVERFGSRGAGAVQPKIVFGG